MLVLKLFSLLSSHWLATSHISNIKIHVPDLLVALSGSFGRRLAVTSQFRGVGSDSSLTLSLAPGRRRGGTGRPRWRGNYCACAERQAGRHRPSERRFSRRRSLTLITGHTNKRVSERASERGNGENALASGQQAIYITRQTDPFLLNGIPRAPSNGVYITAVDKQKVRTAFEKSIKLRGRSLTKGWVWASS